MNGIFKQMSLLAQYIFRELVTVIRANEKLTNYRLTGKVIKDTIGCAHFSN